MLRIFTIVIINTIIIIVIVVVIITIIIIIDVVVVVNESSHVELVSKDSQNSLKKDGNSGFTRDFDFYF